MGSPRRIGGAVFVLGEDGLPRRCAPRNDSFWEAVRCVSCGGVRAPRPTGAGHGVRCRRGVGEIGEAPPVAEEASRFRGSAPIGGHDSGRESAGTTVGNRRPLHGGWGCGTGGRGRTPPLRRASCAVGGTERTDCHVAALLAMTVFLRGAVHTGRWGHRSLRMSWRARLVMGGILRMKIRLLFARGGKGQSGYVGYGVAN